MTDAPPQSDRRRPPLWRNGSFTLMWTSVAASGFGDRMIQLAAFALLGVGISGQAASVTAGVYFFFLLPYIFVSPLGGWLADSLPRKWIMFFCDQSRGVLLLLSALLIPATLAGAIPQESQWKLFGMLAAVGAAAAVFSPTRNATIPGIVPITQLQSANSIILGITTIASLLGMWLGQKIIDETDPASVRLGVFVGAGLYLFSGWFFAFMRVEQHVERVRHTPGTELRRMLHAWHFTRTHRRVMDLVLITVLFWGVANLLVAAISALVANRFAVEGQMITRIAMLNMMLGAGMLASALWLAWLNCRRESAWGMLVACFITAVFILLLAACPDYHLALALCLPIGFFGNILLVAASTLLQSLTPDYMRGRVFGLRDMLNTSSAVVVNLIIWRMPQADDAMVPAMVVAAAIMAIISVRGLKRQLLSGPMPAHVTNVLWRINRLYALVWHRVRWRGRHHVPSRGPVILAANHTTAADPFVMQSGLLRMVRWVMLSGFRFRAAQVLWNAIDPICLDDGMSNLSHVRKIIRLLKAGEIVGLFPEGGLQRDQREMRAFQPGIAIIARHSDAVIVPVWISGAPRVRHMLLHFLLPSNTTVTFGQPWKPDPALTPEELTAELRRRMESLGTSE